MKMHYTFFALILMNIGVLIAEWRPAQVEITPFDTVNSGLIFTGVDCADPRNCFAIANDGNYYRVVYKTTDAGKNWVIIYKPDYGLHKTYPLLKSVSNPSKNKCVIGADSGVVFLTNDMGISWNRINTPIYYQDLKYPTYIDINSLQMNDSNYGIASTYFFMIYTSDGGNNWEFVKKPDSSCSIVDAVILSPSHFIVYAGCKNITSNCPFLRTMFITYDAGNTWTVYDYTNIDGIENPGGITSHLFFTDSLNGWAVGGDPNGKGDQQTKKIAGTKDGGKTWKLQFNELFTPSFELVDLSFHDNYKGIAVSRAGGILRTSNGGNSWVYDSVALIQKNTPSLTNVCYKNIEFPIIVDCIGRIFYDDGETSVQEFQGNQDLIIFPNPSISSQPTTITFSTQTSSQFTIDLINPLGIKVSEIFNGWKEPGEHTIQFTLPANISSGIYWLRLTSQNSTQTIKTIMLE